MTTEIASAPLSEGSSTCAVYPIVNATMTIPEPYVLSPFSSLTAAYRVPSFSFLLIHQPSGKKIMYDLGVRADWKEAFSEQMKELAREPWDPDAGADTADLLEQGGVDPESVDGIIFSHFHWDHTGNISRFPNAELIGGPGTLGGGEPGRYRWDLVEQIERAGRRTRTLDFEEEATVPVGAFEKAVDYFGDGSVMICQTDGHTKGHVSVLVRTTASPPSYVLLGGDTAHHPALLCPCALHSHPQMSTTFRKPSDPPSAPPRTMHPLDPARARDTIERTKRMEGEEGVMVVVAHDFALWKAWERMGGIMWPGGRGIGGWRREGLKIHREYDPSEYEWK